MRSEYYEKVGAVIYGVQRLKFALDCLTEWSSQGNGPAFDQFQAESLGVVEALKVMERKSAELAGKDLAEVDLLVSETRRLHFAVADMMEHLGFTGSLPASLRAAPIAA